MLARGATLGRYVVERVLGQGAMGVVYEVVDPALPERRLALKQVRGDRDAVGTLRFEREARLLARLRHPHVLPVHDLVLGPEGPYLVTDLVVGEALDVVLGRGPLPPRRAAEVARGLADALAAVHAAGLVHRDVKPANVSLDAATGAPVLLDFGLAREVDASSLTRTGALVGTVAYMAPEQRDGEGEAVDGRADVWSLGLVLWALLAGRPPFDGPVPAVLAQLDRGPPSLLGAAPGVPRGLAAIVAAATVVDPDGRYPSAAALRDDLDRWLRGEAPAARRSGSTALALALGLALALALGLAAAVRPDAAPPTEAAPPAPDEPAPADPTPVAPDPPPHAPGPRRLAAWTERWAAGAAHRRGADAERLRNGPLLHLPSLEERSRMAPVAWLDSRTLLVGAYSLPRVERWDLGGPPVHRPFFRDRLEAGGVRGLAVSGGAPGSPRVVAVGLDEGEAILHDAEGGLLHRWAPPEGTQLVSASERRNVLVDLGADGRSLLLAGPWLSAWLLRVVPGGPLGGAGLAPRDELGPVQRAARAVALSPDGRGAAVLAADRAGGPEAAQVLLVAVAGGAARAVDTRATRGRSLVFSPDSATLLVGDVSGTIRRLTLLDPPPDLGKAPRFGDPLAGELEALCFSPDATTLLVLEATTAGARLHAVRWPGGGPWTWRSPLMGKARWLAWSPDGALVAVGHEDGAVSVWAAPP